MESVLTTKDNPYSPFTQWDKWYDYDAELGYDTPSLIARVSNPSLDIEDEEQLDALYLEAALFIMEHDLTGQYIMVQNDSNEGESEGTQDTQGG